MNRLVQILDKYGRRTGFSDTRIPMTLRDSDGLIIKWSEVQNIQCPRRICRVAVVNVGVAERAPGAQVSTNPNQHDLTDQAEQIKKLRIGYVEIEIANIKGRS